MSNKTSSDETLVKSDDPSVIHEGPNGYPTYSRGKTTPAWFSKTSGCFLLPELKKGSCFTFTSHRFGPHP